MPDPLSAYDPIFQAAGDEWNVDPRLLKAMAAQESGGRTNAVSKAGAQGVMQIMPQTQKELGVTDPTDPVQSIYGAAKYMNEGLDKEGSPEGALLYYHGGPGWRQAYGTESAGYVPAIASHYKRLSGPFVVGDSLGVGVQQVGGYEGETINSIPPQKVLDAVNGLSDLQVKGRDVILSSGASNDPSQVALVNDQVKALQDKGAKSVTLLGVGDRPDIAGANATLADIAQKSGATFRPIDPSVLSGDRVHPRNYATLLPRPAPPQGQQ